MKKLTVLILCMLLAVTAAQATAIDESLFEDLPEVTPSPAAAEEEAPESDIRDDGVLRVLLRSMGAPDRLDITLDGEYTVDHDPGFRFERGTHLALNLADGVIYMSVSGLTLSMGTSLTLTRQATGQPTNGLYIDQAKRPENIYSGDLTVQLGESGGLDAVLRINIEDYLLGVIGYEMADSWPAEALKAQAVAARTYAIRRKSTSADRYYDLLDTTGDQVFYGTDDTLANVRAAVEATRGIVLTSGGKYINAFFTASNGGETALPADVWSDDNTYDYLRRKEDPCDLANPNSIVNTLSFAADLSDCETLRALLTDALSRYAEENGRTDEALEIVSVRAVEAVDPVPADSKMYTRLRFDLAVSAAAEGCGPAENDIGAPLPATKDADTDAALRGIDYLRRWQNQSPYQQGAVRAELEEPVSVYLTVYDDIKDRLSLGINSSDCELVSVITADGAFGIELRRYGHGVGMSQRGAQRMAGVEDKHYDEILNFYYDGAKLERVNWDTPDLTSIGDLGEGVGFDRPLPTATPTPAPLRTLKDGEYYAVVSLGDAASALNVREAPGTQNPIVTTLAEGREVIVMTEADANGWVEICTSEYTGYCKLEYLKAN